MGNSNMEHAALALRRQRRRRQRNALLVLLGCVVVLITASRLMMPAISMTRGDLVFGLEGHRHSSACYERVLVCGETEATDAPASALATQGDEEGSEADGAADAGGDGEVAEAGKVLAAVGAAESGQAGQAGQAKPTGHAHTESCYETRLTCGLEEHVHADGRYASGQEQAGGSAAPSEMPAQRFEQKVDGRDDFRVVVEAPKARSRPKRPWVSQPWPPMTFKRPWKTPSLPRPMSL